MSRPIRRTIDLSGPDGNVYGIAALAQTWNRQLGNGRQDIIKATSERLNRESDEDWSPRDAKCGTYEDVLDTFDQWFKGKIAYEFMNDPRYPESAVDDEDAGV